MANDLDQIPSGANVVLPPHGFVHLQASVATDLDVVNAARVSFAKQSAWEPVERENKTVDAYYRDGLGMEEPQGGPMNPPGYKEWAESPQGYKLSENDEQVLRFLLKNRHGTPFEHTFFKFHIRAPIFVFREWHRHRIGVSINEESARYSPLAGDFYIPERDDIREQKGKPGRYTFERMEDDNEALWVQNEVAHVYSEAYTVYTDLMKKGVAKEIARAVLPVGIYSQMIWSCNARSLMNFLSLRNAPQALHEIRVYAEALEDLFAKAMPITHDEFVKNGRVAP